MIPPRLIRTVPTHTSEEAEAFWRTACDLHPGWGFMTFRDPIDPDDFPTTSPHWGRCQNGAQLAGLVRLEALYLHGGIYLDSDVELYRPLNPLLPLSCFAAWEDPNTVPDAVVGATAGHPAILACLTEAIRRLTEPDTGDWHTGNGAWSTGPGVFTALLPSRDDVTLLLPESFYPYHYTERHRRHDDHRGPDTYGAHHWAGSWL